MVGRLAETVAEGMSLLDRLNRGGAGHLVEMLAQLEADGNVRRIADTMPRILQKLETIERMLHAFETAAEATAKGQRATGGLGGMLSMLRDPENQEALRYLTNVGKALSKSTPT